MCLVSSLLSHPSFGKAGSGTPCKNDGAQVQGHSGTSHIEVTSSRSQRKPIPEARGIFKPVMDGQTRVTRGSRPIPTAKAIIESIPTGSTVRCAGHPRRLRNLCRKSMKYRASNEISVSMVRPGGLDLFLREQKRRCKACNQEARRPGPVRPTTPAAKAATQRYALQLAAAYRSNRHPQQ